jgi:phospho-N-acetylmuramoyl-pentapeptide-transferase
VLNGLVDKNGFLLLGLAFLTALVVSLATGAWLIRFFHRKNVIEDTTQPDHAGLNAIQSQKKNVPTMGGLMILAAIVVATLLWNDLRSSYVWIGMLVLIVLGGAGFADDYIKLKRKPSRGLTKTQKLAIQCLLGGIVGYLLIRASGDISITACLSMIPFRDFTLHVGWWFLLWCSFVMAATSNAVNLTDGLDGLAGGLTLIAAAVMALVAVECSTSPYPIPLMHADAPTFSLAMSAMAGSVLGFLWFNRHPAKIFMGDTGSLALGGLLAYAALAMEAEFFLLILGAVFFIEELTVALQIVGFKLTKKRIFPITPIHHYFQVNLKWPEQKIVARAWMLGVVFAVLAMILLQVF